MNNDEIIQELQAIKLLLILSNSEKIDMYMNNVITTPTRKKMWKLIDGVNKPKNLVKELKVSAKAVSLFLTTVKNAGLVKYQKAKAPTRIIDYIPVDWLKETEEV